jgi:P-type Ca2+ transporter type 2C
MEVSISSSLETQDKAIILTLHSNRRLDNKFNIFEGLSKNWFFIGISALMCGGQVLIVFVGGEAFKIRSKQTAELWGVALVLGFLSIPAGVLVRLIPDSYVEALIPKFLKRKARNVPGLTVSDEEMGMYPEPLAEVRNELQFLRRMKGGRLNNLKFAIQHPRETIMRSRSASHSRTNSFQNVRGTGKEDHPGSHPTTPDGLRLSLSARSRSNSLLGAPTVMAGLVAAGVAAGWSPAGRVPSEKDEDEKARQENQEEKKNGDAKANGGDAKTEK